MSRPEPILFAHRGASGYRPENTLAAFALALEQGATGIESDTWLSADGASRGRPSGRSSAGTPWKINLGAVRCERLCGRA